MKLRKLGLLSAAAAAAIAFGTPAMAAVTFQGVTFNALTVDADTLQFSILNADTGATGTWSGINFLNAFQFTEIGTVTGATITSGPGTWNTSVTDGLAVNSFGCNAAGISGACFQASPPVALTDSMIWTIDFVGSNLNLATPHVKVQFLETFNFEFGSSIPAIPEPETYALMLVGFGLLGFVARRRKQSLGSLATA